MGVQPNIATHTYILMHTRAHTHTHTYIRLPFAFESLVLETFSAKSLLRNIPPLSLSVFPLSLSCIRANFIFCLSSACVSTTPDKKEIFTDFASAHQL